MDYFSNAYFALKNSVIKAERRVLKELGFCVHVKHPHKVIITYLQILEHEKNAALAQRAWNYMNDSLRTDVFLKFAPEKIGCACIFLAARFLKVILPQRPPWWELFGATLDEIEEISLTILQLYARPKVRMSKLDEAIENAKKLLQEKKDVKENGGEGTPGSFTPAHVSPNIPSVNSLATKSSSKTASPAKPSPSEKTSELGKKSSSGETKKSHKKSKDDEVYERKGSSYNRSSSPRRKYTRNDSISSDDSESESPSPDRKRKAKKESRARNSPSSDESDDAQRRVKPKDRRNDSDSRPRSRLDKENGVRSYNYDKRYHDRSHSRSRSRSRERRDKNKDRRREKDKARDDRYSDRDHRNNYGRYDYKKNRR